VANSIGIFVCGCRGLVSDSIDLTLMEAELAKLKKSVGARVVHPWLCGDQGCETIRENIADRGLDCVILAGCPENVHGPLFDGLATGAGLASEMLLRLDIREGCAYPQRGSPDHSFRKAANLIRMWTARARLMKPFEEIKLPGYRAAVVAGGGLAGLTAALELAEAGINVTLIEKESFIGGNVARLNKVFPRMCDSNCGLTYLYSRIKDTGRARLMTLSEIVSLRGKAGRYEAGVVTRPRYIKEGICNGCGQCVKACPVEVPDRFNCGLGSHRAVQAPYPMDLAGAYLINREYCPEGCEACSRACPAGAIDLTQKAGETRINFGTMVVASGWSPYPVERVERLGFGVFPDVITNMQMERLAAENGPTGGGIICPGSGRKARRVVFIQCAGSRDVWHQGWCSSVCCTASIKQALYLRERDPGCRVYIFYNDIRTPGDYEDLYVRAQEAGVLFVRTNPAEVLADPSGGLKIIAEDTLTGRVIETTADLVVLAAGMTPAGDLMKVIEEEVVDRKSLLKYGLVGYSGYHTGHRQCFPMETAAQGIYFAGCAQGPMDMGGTALSALAASAKALKAAGREVIVSPHIAVVDKTGCDKCKRCLEECPYGVFHLDEEGFPVPDGLFCRGCHVCVGSCPRQCIVTQGFGLKQQAAMVSSRIKEIAPGEPVVIAFMCENDAYPAVLEAGRRGLRYPPNIHSIPVRCIGSVNMAVIKEGISAGVDGFLLAGCRSGECHYLSGSDRARERLDNLRETLNDMMIEPARVKFLSLGIDDASVFVREACEIVENLRAIGPSPFKNAIVI